MRPPLRAAVPLLGAAALATVLAACSGSETGDAASAADTLTRRQKDSLVSTLPVPGARGVGRAIQARDAANARVEAHDSIR